MFEKFYNKTYEPLNKSINSNLTTWKQYDNNLIENKHGLMEFQVNLSDAAIKGSKSNYHEVDQVLSSY